MYISHVNYLVVRTKLGSPELFLSGLSISKIFTKLSLQFPLTQTMRPDFAEALLTNLRLIPEKTLSVLELIRLSNKCSRPRVSPNAKTTVHGSVHYRTYIYGLVYHRHEDQNEIGLCLSFPLEEKYYSSPS